MTEKQFIYMNLLETEAISVSDDECYYFNEYGTVQKICELLNDLHEENIELKMKIQKVEEIIDNRLSNDFKPVWNDGKTELFIEEKVGYSRALKQLKKKLIKENIIGEEILND